MTKEEGYEYLKIMFEHHPERINNLANMLMSGAVIEYKDPPQKKVTLEEIYNQEKGITFLHVRIDGITSQVFATYDISEAKIYYQRVVDNCKKNIQPVVIATTFI